jgi:tRNA-(ms[2]io[6]A)-hydroxylase
MSSAIDLPLLAHTPASWTAHALADPLALLNDHAHLEKKAAGNALELLLRWPEPNPPEGWVQAMTSIAIDEASHLNTVTRLLVRRGGRLTRGHRNAYAAGLRAFVRTGRGVHELIDRLLVSALIEARSCERFWLLADATTSTDRELHRLYDGLYKSEAGHYRVFVKLARELPQALGVEERWEWMLREESALIAAQPPGPSMHSGWGGLDRRD